MKLETIVKRLDNYFNVKKLEKDPAMSRWLPKVYSAINFDWENSFESDFAGRFNGLMIKGGDNVYIVYCSVFPTEEVLQTFINISHEGDLLFLHHPIDLQCGDPGNQNMPGKGFTAINPKTIREMFDKKLSVYTCHAPMDCSQAIGTNTAIVEALDAKITGEFLAYGNGFAGRICSIDPQTNTELINKLKRLFNIPYVDFAGKGVESIDKIAIVAGGGDDVEAMQEAEKAGAQAYITGEIHSYHDSDWAKQNTIKVDEYAKVTKMALIGVSHASSEYLVMEKQIVPWFKSTFNIPAEGIPLRVWWR